MSLVHISITEYGNREDRYLHNKTKNHSFVGELISLEKLDWGFFFLYEKSKFFTFLPPSH